VSDPEKHQPPSRHERGTVGIRLKPAAAIVRLLARLRAGTATVLDVRPEDEFAYGHLPDA
jgi:hypothetical protein